VSVGESLSLLPLIAELRARRPDLNILVTSGPSHPPQCWLSACGGRDPPVRTGRRTWRGGAVPRHWRPGAALFVESELWPNLIVAAAKRGVRLALLSARITQASA